MNLKKIYYTAFFCVLLFVNTVHSQIIKGVVYDESGVLPGVTVAVKGTSKKTQTNFEGIFEIEKDSLYPILLFSYIGMKTKEVNIIGKDTVYVKLESNNNSLEEVVVVAYGKSQKYHNIGYIHKSNYNNNESYNIIRENDFRDVSKNPLSTFSVDVDRASYSNIRRYINSGNLPPVDAVRIEEMINYFNYDYPNPANNLPFSIYTELASCPWNKDNLLLHIGLQGKKIKMDHLPPSNIVFLIDVSGSMSDYNKLPLLKSSLKLLLENLKTQDRVAMVVYAGSSGLVLPSTSCSEKQVIIDALENLEAGGSTAGGAGLKLAYQVANENFIKNGNNRIILATDGDFNVGQTSNSEMERFIEKEREKGISISVLGFGMGNYKDDKMEIIANKGNGNYAYIDNLLEAKKVLVNEFGGTLFTIAEDVKFQLEFNPKQVSEYRLIGYENRLLNEEDFENDKKDAGEIGAGHTVTALYEIIPANNKENAKKELKYQTFKLTDKALNNNELTIIKLRYKNPGERKSKLIEHIVKNTPLEYINTSDNFRFSASIVKFGMLLRNSKYLGNTTWDSAYELAKNSKGEDLEGYRGEMLRLLKSAELLRKNQKED